MKGAYKRTGLGERGLWWEGLYRRTGLGERGFIRGLAFGERGLISERSLVKEALDKWSDLWFEGPYKRGTIVIKKRSKKGHSIAYICLVQFYMLTCIKSWFITSTESSTATWACNTQLGLPNDEIEILSSGSW